MKAKLHQTPQQHGKKQIFLSDDLTRLKYDAGVSESVAYGCAWIRTRLQPGSQSYNIRYHTISFYLKTTISNTTRLTSNGQGARTRAPNSTTSKGNPYNPSTESNTHNASRGMQTLQMCLAIRNRTICGSLRILTKRKLMHNLVRASFIRVNGLNAGDVDKRRRARLGDAWRATLRERCLSVSNSRHGLGVISFHPAAESTSRYLYRLSACTTNPPLVRAAQLTKVRHVVGARVWQRGEGPHG